MLKRAADNLRILAISMVERAKSGHPGGPMGGADFSTVLFSEFLRFDPDDMGWRFRDRFFLDAGHMSAMLYSQLAFFGKYSMEDLKGFRQWESVTPGHPELDVKRGIENSSGPLGQGFAMALGSAIAERFLASRFGEWMSHKTYCYVSDGGIQEEISQGVGRIAGHLGLSNFIVFYDSNSVQLSTKTSEVTSEDTAKRFVALGWKVYSIDGHDYKVIRETLQKAGKEKEKPVLIIGKTLMGKGSLAEDGTSFEGMVSTHGQPLSKAGGSIEKTIKNLGGDPKDQFTIFPEVQEFYDKSSDEKRKHVAKRKEEQEAWEMQNPDMAKQLHDFLDNILPKLEYSQIPQEQNSATRDASKRALGYFADNLHNMVVSSADLSDSDKTDGFLKKTKPFKKGDFSGAFLQVGVSELTMAGIMSGMALHGGVIPVCGTFFAFSDFMKPQVRLAALMGLPVKYIWTHDAFRVGEDGPTHQPIEQEAQLRLLEKMKNLQGRRSILALRPADSAETAVAWKMALENTDSPTALILSRQSIKDLPSLSGNRYKDALQAQKGAYRVNDIDGKPDVILIANGSEVSTLIDAAMILSDEGFVCQVVSATSEGLFLEQDEEYREEVLPTGVPRFGLTAGLPVALQSMVGPGGYVKGMERFGASAPYKVLDEKFGFTPKQVAQDIKNFLKNR
jgi:transketolase